VPRVPAARIRVVNDAPVKADGEYVLYWMTAFRRLRSNFALERAVEAARECDRPLVILEALRVEYPCASARLTAS
jgi:deoxyribodipyrimidine photo-lyase